MDSYPVDPSLLGELLLGAGTIIYLVTDILNFTTEEIRKATSPAPLATTTTLKIFLNIPLTRN